MGRNYNSLQPHIGDNCKSASMWGLKMIKSFQGADISKLKLAMQAGVQHRYPDRAQVEFTM